MRPAATDAEEFVLDDRDLLRLHELPYRRKAPQRCLHPAAHLRTVSIIDTLSALAQGAADRDYPLPKVTRGAPPRYQRKAAPQLSYARRHRSRGESTRLCMSDSEVKGGDAGSVLSLRTQPPPRKAPSHQHGPGATSTPLRNRTERSGNPVTTRARGWTKVPDWIRAIFRVARKGDLDSLVASLRDMDTTLIWNLSDSRGNNLWHVCAACNHLRCFQWLCQKDVHHVITDENRSNLTPVGCAVKHGNVQIIQWLISKNIALDQLNPSEGQRTLLHLAAKYGQEKMVHWLAEYMNNNDLNINRKDSEGNTAVHLAAKYGHVTALKVLILHGADITAKNEQGLRPHGIAKHSGKLACADYLLTIEACLSLSSEHIITEGNFQCLQQENAEMRNGFKELLVFTKRLLRRQEEMLHYMQAICNSNETVASDEAESDFNSLPRNFTQESKEGNDTKLAKVRYVLEKTQTKVLPEEETRLLQMEEKWRRLRTNKCVPDTRSPLDLVRSHFAQALAKYSDSSIPTEVQLVSSSGSSLSNYSEESAAEEDEKRTPAWLTASQQPWDQALLSHNKVQAFLDSLILPQTADVKSSKEVKSTGVKVITGNATSFKSRSDEHRKEGDHNHENVSLKVLFEKNPELRQEGQTCSVLEVLEPSSSEGEEEFGRKGIKNCGSGDSSTSSFRSTKGYKNSTYRVTENKGKKRPPPLRPDVQVATMKDNSHSILVTNLADLPDSRYRFSLKIQQSQDCEHSNLEGQQSCSEDTIVIEKAPQTTEKRNKNGDHQLSYPEPDLIRGTKQATPPSPPSGSIVDVSVLNNSVQESIPSRDTVSQEGIREEEVEEVRDNVVAPMLERQESMTEAAPLGGTKKRSGFLLKFSLKGRWTSKQKQQQQQQQKKCEEISPEEFRETYTRNGATEIPSPSPSSHENRADDSCLQEHVPFLPQEILHKEPPPPMPMIPMIRREPPPVPLHAPSISNDATPSYKEGNSSENGLIYSSSSLARPESILSKITGGSLSRPASSASQTEDHRRSRSAGFMLQKALSSNELLLHTPDSSVAGRQSPAPSEVSKTESALSPPSDVSKTESARHPPHLGKIEEIVAGQSGEAASMKKVMLSTDVGMKKEAEVAEAAVTCLQDADTQQEKTKKATLSVKKIRKSSRPWYEVSDEEDILIPDKYQTARARSSSDDEVEVAVVA
ncbi:uncharacterized protein LOC135385740 isoform X2 [Ornithodoros turicata]